MIIKRVKYLLMAVAILFGIGFTALIAVFVINPYIARQKVLQQITEQEAAQKEIVADSLALQFKQVNDSLSIERKQDSIIYRQEKQTLLIQFNQKVKKYETRMAAIDTLSDI